MIKAGDMVVFKRRMYGELEVGKYLGEEEGKVSSDPFTHKLYVVELPSGEVVRFNYSSSIGNYGAKGEMYRLVGWITVKEDFIHTNSSYECAAWYENIQVKKGSRYPVWVREDCNGRVEEVCSYVDGLITSDDFGGRFFGVPISDYDNLKNAGKHSEHALWWRDYSFAEWILHQRGNAHFSDKRYSDTNFELELLPNVDAVEHSFESSYDGRLINMGRLLFKEVA